jgi:hypothetical protein
MTTRRADELLAAIRSLPAQERLRLVEQVIHDVAEAQPPAAPTRPGNVIGLFADCPDVIDQVCADAMHARENEPFRLTDG